MAQGLRALVLAEDLSPVPRIHIMVNLGSFSVSQQLLHNNHMEP